MQHYPQSIRNLIRRLARLPGIGEKTAERLAMHILKTSRREAEELAASIGEVKEKVRLCSRCFSLSDGELCRICSDPGRDPSLLCVVEQPADMISIEKSGAYNGLYHVLSGALSPMEGVGPEDIRIGQLLRRVREGTVKELILATGTSVEGEATASYIKEQIAGLDLKVSRIASGVPIGGDLKYVDQVTLKRALDFRHLF
ncbi:MAG: recombination mediator RecR [Desulfobacterales bacterium]|nr:recombination mediator RecR [Desulfobacterales bacterium]MCF8079628.1 recombination mediator RecR [Desulfobacterales bacterium]